MSLFNKPQPKTAKTGAEDAAGEKQASMKELYSEGTNAAGKKAGTGTDYRESYRVLVKPLVTEKATELGKLGKYVFVVDARANKIMVSKAIAAVYGVTPVAVNISNISGKYKRTGRVTGRRKNWKKAVVTLPQGKAIKIYEGV